MSTQTSDINALFKYLECDKRMQKLSQSVCEDARDNGRYLQC